MSQRRDAIRTSLEEGLTYDAIGVVFGITHQRVAQLAKAMGLARRRARSMHSTCRYCGARYLIGRWSEHTATDDHVAGLNRNALADFWSYVDQSGGPDACWPWMRTRTPKGYGHIGGRRFSIYAHRVALELAEGPIPAGLYACHHCDNPPCCNPRHLYAGTPTDNARDRDERIYARSVASIAPDVSAT